MSSRSRDTQPQDDRFGPLDKADMKSPRFEAYYKAQKILPDEEWDDFITKLKEPLPTTFRVAGSRQLRITSPYMFCIHAQSLPELPVHSTT